MRWALAACLLSISLGAAARQPDEQETPRGPVRELPASPPPATRTAQPERLRTLLSELESPSAATRESALQALLTLGRADLPSLLEVVKEAIKAQGPLLPGAAADLRSAVTHVYLSEQPYPSTDEGALGIEMSPVVLPPAPRVPNERNVGIRRAVVITSCRPGLSAARHLQVGDIILGIGPVSGFAEYDSFARAIRAAGADTTLDFQVLRRGRLMRIPVKLSRRPLSLDADGGFALIDVDWARLAEEYWTRTWAPTVGPTH